MSTKDLANNIQTFQMLSPVNNTSNATTVSSTVKGLAETQGCMIQVCAGLSGDTLAANLKYDFALMECATTGGTYTAVANSDVTYGTTDANGIFATMDSMAEDNANYQIGYAGGLGFVRVDIIATGNHSNGMPLSINAITQQIHLPESGSDDGTATGRYGA